MSGNFAIKGGGGRTPNGKCPFKFPFWFSAHLPYVFRVAHNFLDLKFQVLRWTENNQSKQPKNEHDP